MRQRRACSRTRRGSIDHVTIREHCRNAVAAALHLQNFATSLRVIYAGRIAMPSNAATGFGGMVGFELKHGREAGARFVHAHKMF